MLINKILFIILIIICAAFYVLYVWDFSLVLLIVIASLPLIMFVITFITKKLLSAELAIREHTVSKNEVFDLQLRVSNRSIFPVGKAEALIEYYNIFNNEVNSIELHFPVQARNSHRLTFQLSSKFCGIIKIRSAYITIFDPLRIFRFRVGKNLCENIVILPQGHEIGAYLTSTDRLNDESQSFSEHKPGSDPSEIFGLREYIPGDKPNRIHWKLSSKKDEFIVKEYSLPVDSPTSVFLNLHCCEKSEYTLPIYDTLLEAFVSLSQFLLENERIHNLIYYSAAERQFTERLIDSADTLASVITELILSISDDLNAELPETYFSEYRGGGWASFTFITAENNENLLSFIDDEIDSDIKNIIMVVKNSSSAEKIGRSYASVNMIPVVIGRISSSVTDIEL